MKKINFKKLQVLIQRDEDGLYIASCPAIKGCHSQGDSYEEAMKNIKEAIELNLEYLENKKKKALQEIDFFPKFIATEELLIAA